LTSILDNKKNLPKKIEFSIIKPSSYTMDFKLFFVEFFIEIIKISNSWTLGNQDCINTSQSATYKTLAVRGGVCIQGD
jgi:hypothetical protein